MRLKPHSAATGGILLALVLVACGPRFVPESAPAPGQAPNQPSIAPQQTQAPQPTGTAAPAGPQTRVTKRIVKGTKGETVTGGVIRVGGLFPLSGGLAALGTPAFQGADAYFRWVNDHGGVRGKTFDFRACNDQANDTQSSTCAKKLVDQDGIFVMGPSFTPFSLTVIKQLEDAGVPWIGFDGINVEGFDAANVVSIGAPIEPMAHALLPYWYAKEGKPKKIGAVVLDVAPAKTYMREAQKVICPKLGCEIIAQQEVQYTTTEYGTICRKMRNDGVDAIWIITDPASAVKLLVACSSLKPPKGFLGQHGIYLDLTLEQSGQVADGILANSAVLPDSVDTAATREMKKIIRTYYPDAEFGYFTALSFASARMVVDLVARMLESGTALTRDNILRTASRFTSYDCNGLCKGVNLSPPARKTGGNHNVWIVRADFSSGKGRWVYESGPIDAFRSTTWPCPGKPCSS
jgi:branched-chain amino acid transport system substrate-binding protein